jgi:hypothetical protein
MEGIIRQINCGSILHCWQRFPGFVGGDGKVPGRRPKGSQASRVETGRFPGFLGGDGKVPMQASWVETGRFPCRLPGWRFPGFLDGDSYRKVPRLPGRRREGSQASRVETGTLFLILCREVILCLCREVVLCLY